MKMTPGMKQVLEEARRNGELRRARTREPGADPWPASWQTLHALVRRGYLERGERRNRKGEPMDTWTILPAGVDALNPRVRPVKDTIRSLRAKGNARFRVMVGGVWTDVSAPEPEPIDTTRLSVSWAREACVRHERDKPTKRRAA